MRKALPILLLFFLLLCACEKNTWIVNTDPNYPTIIEKADPGHLAELRSEFARENMYLKTSLDEYGFCGYSDNSMDAETPSIDTTVTESEAIEIAKKFLVRNSEFTGIKNTGSIDFNRVNRLKGFWDGNSGWHLLTANQSIDSIEVLSTSILINLRGKEVYYCVGNWFPDIYIPDRFSLTGREAQDLLVNRTVTHFTWGGPVTLKITSESLQGSTIDIVALPLEKNNHLEMHIAWKIYVPGVSFILYVDVMSGEVIREEPTFIS